MQVLWGRRARGGPVLVDQVARRGRADGHWLLGGQQRAHPEHGHGERFACSYYPVSAGSVSGSPRLYHFWLYHSFKGFLESDAVSSISVCTF